MSKIRKTGVKSATKIKPTVSVKTRIATPTQPNQSIGSADGNKLDAFLLDKSTLG